MANFNLASLPPSMLHKILSKVATTSIRDFGSAGVAFFGFNAIGREDHFYKSADLIFLNDWTDEVNVVTTFRLKCYQLGNPEAIYL
ncbi:BnaC04g55000D [Brassica napus]|uniref:BnaC04g55000D protein n=2 Tax=Brassica napus TaxID=3708 RepID=A0A078J5T2_BRANA|nr:BnaC04g55000D [Brassica napus]